MTYLIKIGGSLTPRYVLPLYNALEREAINSALKVFIFPGGGEFADLIRKYREQVNISDETTHMMALASLDQNAYLISDICRCPCVKSIRSALSAKKPVSVIAPYAILSSHSPFQGYKLNIDVLSSTSSALHCAKLLKAGFIIATDVDGVFDKDPRKRTGKPSLLKNMPSSVLRRLKRGGPLDETIPGLLERYKMDAWVVNGKYPQRTVKILRGEIPVRATLIRSCGK